MSENGKNKIVAVALVFLLIISVATVLLGYSMENFVAHAETKLIGNTYAPAIPDVTVSEDAGFVNVNNGLFTFKFAKDSAGYNSIYEDTGLLVQDERWTLERLFKAPDDYRVSGTAETVSYERVNEKHVVVKRSYSDLAFGNYFNITYDMRSLQNVKVTVEGLIGTENEYRLVWDVSGINRTSIASGTNKILLSNVGQDTISLDYNDVYASFGDITAVDASNWASEKKISQVFYVGNLTVGDFTLDPSFGYEYIGESYISITDYIRGSKFTTSNAGTVDTVTVALVGDSGTEIYDLQALIYKYSDYSLVASSDVEYDVELGLSESWNEFTFSSEALSASTDYILAVWSSVGSYYSGEAFVLYDTGVSGQGFEKSIEFGEPPDPFAPDDSGNHKYSIYCNYTATSDTTDPTYSMVGHTSTKAGVSCTFYGYFDDDVELDYYIFSTNNTGVWTNNTAVAFASTPSWGNTSKTLNSTVSNVVQYRYYWNDTSNNWGTMSVQSLTVTSADTTNPTYSLVGHTSIVNGSSCTFYGYFNDETALSKYIFSTNNTGTWTNETATAFGGTPAWGNATKTLNATEGYTIQYRYYWNDTSNNWGTMSVQSFVTASASYMVSVSSSPEIYVSFQLNGTAYSTPSYQPLIENTYLFTASAGKVYGGLIFGFSHWLVNGTTQYATQSVTLTISGNTTVVAYYETSLGYYTFYGPIDEETGLEIDENVSVTVNYASTDVPQDYFSFNDTQDFSPAGVVLFFQFTFDDNSTREYWVDPSEDVTTIYIFYGATTTYTINFLDTTGILDTYPYVTIKRYVNGTLYTVEKRKVDVYNSVLANLIASRTYTIYLGNERYTYVFGDLTMTGTTGVQLIVRGVDFEEETLILQKYISVYSYRNESIFVVYSDTKEETDSVTVTISNSTSTVYSTTIYANGFNLEWDSADNETTYYVSVAIEHDSYGDLSYKQTLLSDPLLATPPFSLAFLGEWGFDSYALIPAMILLCVAGCFSKVNAYVGMILMCIFAALLAWIGWLPIPAGYLIAGFALSVIGALVYTKSHGGMGQ